jgi:hypothetical protein
MVDKGDGATGKPIQWRHLACSLPTPWLAGEAWPMQLSIGLEETAEMKRLFRREVVFDSTEGGLGFGGPVPIIRRESYPQLCLFNTLALLLLASHDLIW